MASNQKLFNESQNRRSQHIPFKVTVAWKISMFMPVFVLRKADRRRNEGGLR